MNTLEGKWIADLGDGTFKNPILYADYSDPDVIRVGDDFYMTASSFTYVPGLPILHSKDLVNWEIINYAVKKLPDRYNKPVHGCGVWAPAIRYNDGKFYIYYGDPDIGIFMTWTEDPYGEWSDLILVKEGVGLIDTCPLWDDDGKAYIVHGYANSRCGIKSHIAVCEMTWDGTKAIGEDKIIFNGTISQPTIEGPKFYKRDGMYYVLSPAGGVPTGWQVAMRSKNVYGPYEDHIVLRQGLTEINGPHQGGLVELESGESWFVHFQDLEVIGRIIHLQPVEWVDGWPVMGENADTGLCGQPVMRCKKPNVGAEYPITTIPTSDDFSSDKLGLQWQWQANNKEEWYSLTENKGSLRLYSEDLKTKEDKYLWNLPNLLTQLWQAPSMVATVKVSMPKGVGNNKAVLAVIGQKYGYVALTDEGIVEYCNGNFKTDNREWKVNDKCVGTTEAYLRLEVISCTNSKEASCRVSYSVDGSDFISLGEFECMQGKWVGAKFALACVGEKGGYADFSNFLVV